MDLELLLAHADDSAPVLGAGLPSEAAARAPRPAEQEGPRHLRYDSADPSSLPDQRWGIVAPEGAEGDRLLGLIDPLRRARQEGQGGAPVRVYRVPAELGAEEAARWKREVYWDESVPEEELPRYLLVLGDADRVSLEFQQVLASDGFTGRLVFPDDRGYEAYVDKVLRWERTPSPEAQARALFYTVHDGTAATQVGYSALMTPSLALSRERREKGSFPTREILEIGEAGGSADELLEQASARAPGVLFSISHGLGAPRRGWRSADEQRALQGAMSLGEGMHLAAEDVSARPFLPGGFWFFLACYGAGTPSRSAYRHWLEGLREAGKFSGRVDSVLAGLPSPGARPFVAALPQAVLANPDGPLAVIGHIDLAWTYSFQDQGPVTRSRPSRFQGVFRSIVGGARAGVAHAELTRFFTEASVELSMFHDEDTRIGAGRVITAVEQERRANLWMLRQDLAGYVLLGDPAVRLPLAAGASAAAKGPIAAAGAARAKELSAAAASILGIAPSGGAPARDPARMEEAVIEVLRGDASEKEIAATHGIARSELTRWVDAYRSAGRAALGKTR